MNLALSTAAVSAMLSPFSMPGKAVFPLGEIISGADNEFSAQPVTQNEVSAARIAASGAQSIGAALEQVPGISFGIGPRREMAINMRGFSQFDIPIMFDGIPQSVPYDGYIDPGKMPVSNVSKISVTKGAGSALNGPNAMGGVINVVTVKPQKELEIAAQGDFSESTNKGASLNVGSRHDLYYFTVGGSYAQSDGFKMSDKFTPTADEPGRIRANSAHISRNLSAKFGATPADGHEYAFGLNVLSSRWGLPPDATAASPRYWRFSDWDKKTFYLAGDTALFDGGSMRTRLYHDKYHNILDAYDDATFTTQKKTSSYHSTYDDYSWGGSAAPEVKLGPRNTLGMNFTLKYDVHRSRSDNGNGTGVTMGSWDRYSQAIYSAAAQDQLSLSGALSLTAGASYDVQRPLDANGGAVRAVESSFNPQVGANWAFAEDGRVYAGVGKKTRFPTLKELYSSYLGLNTPNPNLSSERAVSYELGAEKFFEPLKTRLAAVLYYSDISGLITTMGSGANKQWTNVGKASYRGVELSAQTAPISENILEFNYAYLDARDETPGAATSNLADRPAHKLFLSDAWQAAKWLRFFGKVLAYSERYYQPTASTWGTVSCYWTADANAEMSLYTGLSLQAGARNIFDRNYSESYGYPQEGRVFFAAAKYSF
jgi:iron complex outermembrane receptor protein